MIYYMFSCEWLEFNIMFIVELSNIAKNDVGSSQEKRKARVVDE